MMVLRLSLREVRLFDQHPALCAVTTLLTQPRLLALPFPPYGASVQSNNDAPQGEGDSSPQEDCKTCDGTGEVWTGFGGFDSYCWDLIMGPCRDCNPEHEDHPDHPSWRDE